jgi:hypothetical protein
MAELFENFEVEREPRWPIMLRLAGGSIVLHMIMLAVAFYVPAVRDALNLASTFSDSGFVDKDYKKINIEDRAQILNLPKFQYPEGYFQRENGMPIPAAVDPLAPQIIAQAPPVVMTPPVMAKMPRGRQPRAAGIPPNPISSPSPSPTPIPAAAPNNPAGAQTANAEQPKTAAEAEAEMAKVAQQNNVAQVSDDDINRKPLKDWLKTANDLKSLGKLDLSKSVEVTIIADFDENGKLQGGPRVTEKSGDKVLVDLAKELVAAIIESNLTKFLRDPKTNRLDTRQLTITIKLNDQELLGKVQYDAASPERANEISKGYNGLLFAGKIARQGKDEEPLLKNTKAAADGKQIILNFTMPRQEASELIKKQLTQPAT